ncbi:hypothetical protein AVEN_198331-1 [Araneus ventricosus]|uniref:Uncharacterized protein n=1 Tax=Araneus ventricosus TaxID=182803 RepID=A0A4Y2LC55_ARAVE|nr:hypothetical protein AVEN_198331-1 [Araneus ventricosus]
MMGFLHITQWHPLTLKPYIWTALDMSWWSGSLACWIVGPIIAGLLLLGSNEDIGVRDPVDSVGDVPECSHLDFLVYSHKMALVTLTSSFKARRELFWDRPRRFEHRSDEEDDT